MLTGVTIAYTITSTLAAYSLTTATITPVYSTVALGGTSFVSVSRTITTPAPSSGNPGYLLGKPITITAPATFNAVADPATTNCYAAGAAAGTISILFG